MRVRNIPGVEQLLEKSPFFIQEPGSYKGYWHDYFRNQNPIHLEIGMGKGKLLTWLAETNPYVNYMGMEKSQELLWKACQLLSQENSLKNIALIYLNADKVLENFAAGEIERIYLNFSDPWPKARNAKRRLNHGNHLKRYEALLNQGGELHLKTDNLPLFEFGLGELKNTGFNLVDVTYDLHQFGHDPRSMTEYELKFHEQGKKICRLIARK